MRYYGRLLTDQAHRLGRGGVHEIMNHEFFAGVDWDVVRRGYKVCTQLEKQFFVLS